MRLLILVGPTGAGKTATAIELCHQLNGEIISADSMQIYRGCDIVTAKASPQEQQAAPHHLIDICDPRETYSAARWAQDAQNAIEKISKRGKLPIVTGGTGFYINALLHPEKLAAAPPDEELRAQLEGERLIHGNEWLHQKLQTIDENAAARLHSSDSHRIIRAIEIAVSGSQMAKRQQNPLYEPLTFGLTLPRAALYERLNQRVDKMMALGALDELKNLLDSGVPHTAPALQGVGYKQLLPTLNDESLLSEALELWKRDTRRYAKRQMTWFRHQLPVQWLEVDENTSAEHLSRLIVAQWNAAA